MTLEEWVVSEVAKGNTNKTSVLRDLADRSGVSLVTLLSVAKGMPITMYPKAQAISAATEGQVTVKELCER